MDNSLTLSLEQQQAITETVHRERRRLFDYIRRRVRSDEDAEDILQDVFYQFVNTVQQGVVTQAAAWLYRVAGNKIIDSYRKKKTERTSLAGSEDDDGEFSLEDLLFDRGDEPDERYERALIWEELNAALAELPAEQRNAFIQQEFEGKTFKEISAETGEPINTLISRKRYAVLYLRQRLQNIYNEFFD